MPSNKTSIKVDKELNRQVSIIALLEKIKKEDFVDKMIRDSLLAYQDKYKRYKFR